MSFGRVQSFSKLLESGREDRAELFGIETGVEGEVISSISISTEYIGSKTFLTERSPARPYRTVRSGGDCFVEDFSQRQKAQIHKIKSYHYRPAGR